MLEHIKKSSLSSIILPLNVLTAKVQMAKYDFQKESKIPYLECAGYQDSHSIEKTSFPL